ncbi:hypothetical protein EHJ13_21265 [Cronobacter dublinensis]|uniref:Uncharacterized protein n=1 Tax=Cronobacter dublinensis TaxID=413497 RepID=A0A9Q4TAL3_9ENTR|nr:hypothetical protein [Cronobacter dublinensis]NCH89943.1 hypothetical protein [Cronobacter dublinensis]
MNKRYVPLIVFLPSAIYCIFYAILNISGGNGLFLKSMLASLFAVALYAAKFFEIKKAIRDNSSFSLKRNCLVFSLAALLLLVLLVGTYLLSPNDNEFLLVFGAVVHSALAFMAAAFTSKQRKAPDVFRDSATGQYYRYEKEGLTVLTEIEANSIAVSRNISSIPSFSLENTNLISNSYGVGGENISINPSSGLPMNGGISGLDVNGNSWGTNFNDPSSNNPYDPNRGY